MVLLIANEDRRKSSKKIKNQIESNLKCVVPGCDCPLTMFLGPNENKLCREHQIKQREYGGLARFDRIYTFHKVWECKCCGYNPQKDPWFDNPPVPWDNEAHKFRAMRATLVCDHIILRREGGKDTADNIQTLCQNCNAKKTNNKKDYLNKRDNPETS